MLSGVVVVSGKDSAQHQGVTLTVEGTVNLQLSAKSVGVFEAFYNSVKVRMLKLPIFCSFFKCSWWQLLALWLLVSVLLQNIAIVMFFILSNHTENKVRYLLLKAPVTESLLVFIPVRRD